MSLESASYRLCSFLRCSDNGDTQLHVTFYDFALTVKTNHIFVNTALQHAGSNFKLILVPVFSPKLITCYSAMYFSYQSIVARAASNSCKIILQVPLAAVELHMGPVTSSPTQVIQKKMRPKLVQRFIS